MNKKLKCVIFDLDGTLIDSGPDLLSTLNYVLAENNLKEIDRSVIGNLVILNMPFFANSINRSPLFPILVVGAISLANSIGDSSILKFTKTKWNLYA